MFIAFTLPLLFNFLLYEVLVEVANHFFFLRGMEMFSFPVLSVAFFFIRPYSGYSMCGSGGGG